jgi:hypothetical protein
MSISPPRTPVETSQQKQVRLLERDQAAQQSRVNATERLMEGAQRKADREQMDQGLPPTQVQPLGAVVQPLETSSPSSAEARFAHTRALNEDAQQRLDQTTEALDAATAPTPTPMAAN